jgi:site-specific DNA-methyltransferase (adenine-specific)
MSDINFHFDDCMNIMRDKPDKFWDLALCDVQYGIDVANMSFLREVKTTVKQKNGTRINGNRNKRPYTLKDWDKQPPPQEYFDELKRVSREQIIFGVEYVKWQGLGKGRIKWNKGVAEGVSFKGYEKAYCSLIDGEVDLNLLWAGMCQAKSISEPMTHQGNKRLNEKRIHPCHKPVFLYDMLLLEYAKQGDKILDTHGGSMSSAIACDKQGFDLDICEIDKDYFDAGVSRFKTYKSQLILF